MLTYNFSDRGKTPIYEHLYNLIKKDILSGKIKKDEKLPSKRAMASHHDISVITVQNAYEQLVVEGYIRSVEKKGYFVNEVRSGFDIVEAKMPTMGIEDKAKKEYMVDFSSNNILYDSFPFNTWSKVMRKTINDSEHDFLTAPNHAGVRELREAISKHLMEFRGMNINPSNIIVGAGMEYLYSVIVQLLGRNQMIAIEDPGHGKVKMVYEGNGVKCIPVPVRQDGIDIEKLEQSKAKIVHLSPSHQFPTGCVMPINRRMELIEIVKNNKGFIIEDDYDSEFRFHGKPVPTLVSMCPNNVIYLNTFSKSLAPSIRIAYMVLPDSLMRIFDEKLSFYSSTVSGFEQYTLANFISEGYYSRHINRMRNYYKNYRSQIIDLLQKSKMKDDITIKETESGLHFILQINKNIDDVTFIKKLEKKSIRLKPISDYCYRNKDRFEHQFIINYSGVEQEKLREAIGVIEEVLMTEHNFTIDIPENVEKIISILEKEGYEAYAVGGCVRDSMLGRKPKDWDITTSAQPEEVKRIFRKTIDTGIQHGTVTVRMRGESYEVTTYRIDGDYVDNRHPENVSYTSDLKEDLKRRDFTINAMAYNPSKGLVDEFGGIKDLDRGLIRCVGNPLERFGEDALRIMRGVRFAAQLGFEIDAQTREAMKKLAPNLEDISKERIREEIEKLILSDNPSKLVDAYELGITKVVLPEFDSMMECGQTNTFHIYSVGVHTIKVIENIPPTKTLRWAALLHDVAKPDVGKFYNGTTHFKGHEEAGAKKAASIMKRLRMDNKTIDNVKVLIKYHDKRTRNVTGYYVRKLVSAVGKDLFTGLLLIMRADIEGKTENARESGIPMIEKIEKEFDYIMENNVCTSLKELAIGGNELIALGVVPGKEVGILLKACLEHVLEYPDENNKEALEKYVLSLIK